MSFSMDREDDVLTVAVVGQLTVANRQDFKQAILDQMAQGARIVLVDLNEAAYVDSSGLGALVSLNRRLHDGGGELRLIGLNEDLKSLFELTRLDTLFPIYSSREEALGKS